MGLPTFIMTTDRQIGRQVATMEDFSYHFPGSGPVAVPTYDSVSALPQQPPSFPYQTTRSQPPPQSRDHHIQYMSSPIHHQRMRAATVYGYPTNQPRLYPPYALPLPSPLGMSTPGFSTGEPAKRRRRLTPEETRILSEVFEKNQKPNAVLRSALAQRLNMTSRAVQIWFQNKRAKVKRDSIGKKKGKESSESDTCGALMDDESKGLPPSPTASASPIIQGPSAPDSPCSAISIPCRKRKRSLDAIEEAPVSKAGRLNNVERTKSLEIVPSAKIKVERTSSDGANLQKYPQMPLETRSLGEISIKTEPTDASHPVKEPVFSHLFANALGIFSPPKSATAQHPQAFRPMTPVANGSEAKDAVKREADGSEFASFLDDSLWLNSGLAADPAPSNADDAVNRPFMPLTPRVSMECESKQTPGQSAPSDQAPTSSIPTPILSPALAAAAQDSPVAGTSRRSSRGSLEVDTGRALVDSMSLTGAPGPTTVSWNGVPEGMQLVTPDTASTGPNLSSRNGKPSSPMAQNNGAGQCVSSTQVLTANSSPLSVVGSSQVSGAEPSPKPFDAEQQNAWKLEYDLRSGLIQNPLNLNLDFAFMLKQS